MVFIAKPPKSIFKPHSKAPLVKKYIKAYNSSSGDTSNTVGKWSFKKQVTNLGKNGTCGRVELDYNINPHTSVGVYGDGCIGNPFATNPYPTTVSGGGMILDFHF